MQVRVIGLKYKINAHLYKMKMTAVQYKYLKNCKSALTFPKFIKFVYKCNIKILPYPCYQKSNRNYTVGLYSIL